MNLLHFRVRRAHNPACGIRLHAPRRHSRSGPLAAAARADPFTSLSHRRVGLMHALLPLTPHSRLRTALASSTDAPIARASFPCNVPPNSKRASGGHGREGTPRLAPDLSRATPRVALLHRSGPPRLLWRYSSAALPSRAPQVSCCSARSPPSLSPCRTVCHTRGPFSRSARWLLSGTLLFFFLLFSISALYVSFPPGFA